jgi:dTDP-4-dehydrorhamnose reductase
MASRRRVVISGTTGQLGRALVAAQRDDWDILPLNRSDINLLDWPLVRDSIAAHTPDLVIHCAAVTDVDGCERDPQLAYQGNALTTRYVAQAAAACDAQLVYVSTNFVFDGTKPSPYHEFDDPAPISIYGHSKLAGEREALAATMRTFIVRTAMVFAPEGRNFVLTIRRLMAERDRLTVVNDQFGNPTYAPDLANGIVQLVDHAPYGVYHLTNTGAASWYDWARKIAAIDGSTTTIDPIPAADYRRDATPPANGVLTSLMLPQLGIELPDWQDALRRCLAR